MRHTGKQLKGCYSSMSVRGLLLRKERKNVRAHLTNQCVTSRHILANALTEVCKDAALQQVLALHTFIFTKQHKKPENVTATTHNLT